MQLALRPEKRGAQFFTFPRDFNNWQRVGGWHVFSVTTGMTNNSRYQISSRAEGPNVVPKFGKASRWQDFINKLQVHKINSAGVIAKVKVMVIRITQKLRAIRKNPKPFAKAGRFPAVVHSTAAYSMSSPAFNSQLG